MASKRQRGERNPAHEQRRVMVNKDDFDVPPENDEAAEKIGEILQRASDDVLKILDSVEIRDEGRVSAVLDLITQANAVSRSALKLPFANASARK